MASATASKRKTTIKDKAEPAKVSPRNTLNDLTSKEWISETVSVWAQKGLGKGHAEAQIEREHPAPFSYQDVGRLIRFFTKSGQTVLDPFVGVGSTLKAAAIDGRNGVGIELNARYAKLARKRLDVEVDSEVLETTEQQIIRGDARTALPKLAPGSIDLLVTSPPYWNILQKKDHKAKQERESKGLDTQYSKSKKDLGNIEDYGDFLEQLTEILELSIPALKPKGHMCIIVGDFRHKTKYYMFHADLMNNLETLGMVPKGLQILYQRHKRVFPYGYPAAFVPNLHHQYILILQKP